MQYQKPDPRPPSAPHPGELVKHDCLDAVGLTVTEGARVLGVTREQLSKIVNGRSGISPEMAVRLSKAFGSSPEAWLKMQLAYDLAQVQKKAASIEIRRYEPA